MKVNAPLYLLQSPSQPVSKRSLERSHETYRMLRRKSLIVEAVRNLKIIEGLFQSVSSHFQSFKHFNVWVKWVTCCVSSGYRRWSTRKRSRTESAQSVAVKRFYVLWTLCLEKACLRFTQPLSYRTASPRRYSTQHISVKGYISLHPLPHNSVIFG